MKDLMVKDIGEFGVKRIERKNKTLHIFVSLYIDDIRKNEIINKVKLLHNTKAIKPVYNLELHYGI